MIATDAHHSARMLACILAAMVVAGLPALAVLTFVGRPFVALTVYALVGAASLCILAARSAKT
ncbi:hypothetical protein ACSBLW_15420 [Thioclava sp. FR2]|uniref:hypothetical protein n=1 Tax=Thioclava sp. FR2 TaxID=3445780 RepID=UPI003EB7CFAA